MILLRPTKAPITQLFGENPQMYPATNGHMGVDFGLPEGSPVMASAEGQISWAYLDPETARTPTAGYGMYVRIEHAPGVSTIYGHLSTLAVTQGEFVRMGQVIGASGNTGRSTGPHLHWEYRTTPTQFTDPLPYMVERIPHVILTGTITAEGDGLRVRTGPSKSRGTIRTLKAGDQIQIVNIAGDDVWLQTEDGYAMFRPEWVELNR